MPLQTVTVLEPEYFGEEHSSVVHFVIALNRAVKEGRQLVAVVPISTATSYGAWLITVKQTEVEKEIDLPDVIANLDHSSRN